ncbi:plasmid partitioning protein RepB [Cognatishimia sp. WU-CL00825]|uniref:plasmid partitioning protein RepB n=1 Tax=Cognatishimia sp. WU-CL00825 TaxID=3127658 RepID=UPI003109E853
MARKNLLKSLMETAEEPNAGQSPPAPSQTKKAATPRYTKGAIGAVSQSIAELKSRSVMEVDVALVDWAGNVDRLEHNDADHQALMQSIQEYGQQVPVLLRPNPNDPERYQVVYGRRRLRALRDLGLTAKALIRDLDDRALIIAQGQENSARKDLTFIERANFARQMREAGYDRKVIGDALHVDKTVISRMLSVADLIPVTLIEAIGPAPSVGRDRWLALAAGLEKSAANLQDAVSLAAATGGGSDLRFKAVFDMIEKSSSGQGAAQKRPSSHAMKTKDGAELGRVTWKAGQMIMTLSEGAGDGFNTWLLQNFAEIHQNWKNQTDE